jgi:hypothetical protein
VEQDLHPEDSCNAFTSTFFTKRNANIGADSKEEKQACTSVEISPLWVL